MAEFLAQPGHRPIELVQREFVDTVDPIVLLPTIRRPVGATTEQPVQHGQEHRAFQGERMLALAGQRLDNVAAAGLLPQTLEHQGRTNTAHRHHIRRATTHCIKDDCLRGKSRARA